MTWAESHFSHVNPATWYWALRATWQSKNSKIGQNRPRSTNFGRVTPSHYGMSVTKSTIDDNRCRYVLQPIYKGPNWQLERSNAAGQGHKLLKSSEK
jgi:hypothetical protein